MFGQNPHTYRFGEPNQGNPFGNDPFRDLPKMFGQDGEGQDQQAQPSTPRTGPVHLGVQVDADKADRKQFNVPDGVQGALVVNIAPGSVASAAGLQPGDVIQSFNGKPIATAEDLTNAIKGVKWGDRAKISYSHYDEDGSLSRTDKDIKF